MTYSLDDVLSVDLNNFELLNLDEDRIPAESEALCCEYVFGYSVAAHEAENGFWVVIKDHEEEGGGDQSRLIQSKPEAYCAAFVLAMARDAAAQSAELFMSNSVVQKLYEAMQAQADDSTTVIYRDAKTYQVNTLGTFANRREAEQAFTAANLKSLSVWYWASAQLTL